MCVQNKNETNKGNERKSRVNRRGEGGARERERAYERSNINLLWSYVRIRYVFGSEEYYDFARPTVHFTLCVRAIKCSNYDLRQHTHQKPRSRGAHQIGSTDWCVCMYVCVCLRVWVLNVDESIHWRFCLFIPNMHAANIAYRYHVRI